jgi:hypothetical protein
MNRTHCARCIRRSGGILAGLAGPLLASITAEQATDPVTRAGRWVNGVYVRVRRRADVDWPDRRERHLLQRPLPDTALALQVPSPCPRYTHPTGRYPDVQ